VQQLNREGVEAVNKHRVDKAKKLFYQAYLLDPDDPFTLNNLGYISELQGKVERAQRYYQLASRQDSETVIDQASVPELKGKQLTEITGSFGNRELRINETVVRSLTLKVEPRLVEALVEHVAPEGRLLGLLQAYQASQDFLGLRERTRDDITTLAEFSEFFSGDDTESGGFVLATAGSKYYVVYPEANRQKRKVRLFRDWVLKEAGRG
jgi:tetratricopeptide (TPR) repeat protein